jgi:opacity protein-like surface antigen
MKKRCAVLQVLILIVVVSACSLAFGQDVTGDADQWSVHFTPYFWIAEIDGDATLRGRTGPAEASFSDIWDNLDFGLMGRVEAWKDRWGLVFDGLYMDLGAEFSTPQGLISADIDFKQTMLEFGIGHRLWETTVGQESDQELSFDLLGGGRYMNLEGEVDVRNNGPLSGLGLAIGRTFRRREEWVDPFVGGRLRWDIDEKLAAAVRFDFGGFGVGDGSNLTWNLLVGIDYKLKENMSLKAGYRVFDIDYDSGSGTKEFGLDTQFRGPIFGLTIYF